MSEKPETPEEKPEESEEKPEEPEEKPEEPEEKPEEPERPKPIRRTMPHQTQIQSTDLGKWDHLFDEMVEVHSEIDALELVQVQGIADTKEELLEIVDAVGFYKVIQDSSLNNESTEYYYDGETVRIMYGIDDIEDVVKEVEESLRPKIPMDRLEEFEMEGGDTEIKIPLEGNGINLSDKDGAGDIKVNGEVIDKENLYIDDEGNLVITVPPVEPSDKLEIELGQGSIVTDTGREIDETDVTIVVNGVEIIIENSELHETVVGNEELELKFDVVIERTPQSLTFHPDKITTASGLIKSIEYDEEEAQIVIELDKGLHQDIVFYKGVFVADRTESRPLRCVLNAEDAKEPDVEDEPEEGYPWEHTFIVESGESSYDLNGDVEDVPEDIEFYGDDMQLYYMGKGVFDVGFEVPLVGVDNYKARNPHGGYYVVNGEIIFERAVIGVNRYKIVKGVADEDVGDEDTGNTGEDSK